MVYEGSVSHTTDAELAEEDEPSVDEVDITDDEALGEPVVTEPPPPSGDRKTFAERTAEREARKG